MYSEQSLCLSFFHRVYSWLWDSWGAGDHTRVSGVQVEYPLYYLSGPLEPN